MRKSWTARDYKSEKDLSCSNEGTMVVFSDEQVGSMVEDICGEAVRANFEDAECGPDPMHPSDIECSSIEDGDSSDDDEIKELFAEQVLPAKARVRDLQIRLHQLYHKLRITGMPLTTFVARRQHI